MTLPLIRSHAHCPAPLRRRPGILTLVALWKSRHQLGRLDARALDDIGVRSDEAQNEARRPIWDVPDNWRA